MACRSSWSVVSFPVVSCMKGNREMVAFASLRCFGCLCCCRGLASAGCSPIAFGEPMVDAGGRHTRHDHRHVPRPRQLPDRVAGRRAGGHGLQRHQHPGRSAGYRHDEPCALHALHGPSRSAHSHVLHGWRDDGKPAEYELTVGDMHVSNLPTNIRDWQGGGTERVRQLDLPVRNVPAYASRICRICTTC